MINTAHNHHIEDNFRTFKDKYINLFHDIKTGLAGMGSLYAEAMHTLQALIETLSAEDFVSASSIMQAAEFEPLLEESFTDNLKLESDLASLRVRMINMRLLEEDVSHEV